MTAPAHSLRVHAPFRGIAFKLAATLAFSGMAAAVKYLGPHYPLGELIFFRCFFALVPVLVIAAFRRDMAAVVRTRRPRVHILRSFFGISAMFLSFYALMWLPLADWTAISFGMPIFGVVFAALWLREPVGPWRWSAVIAGFAGIGVMTGPQLTLSAEGMAGIGALVMLASTLFSAATIVTIREISQTENSLAIVFYFMAACSVASAVTLPFAFIVPGWSDLALLILSGLLGGLGQFCNTTSYRFASPALLAPFDYVAMIWAVALGIVLFSEFPELYVLAGAVIVTAAGLVIIYRERRLGRRALEPAEPDAPVI